jgi:hypothetical protein
VEGLQREARDLEAELRAERKRAAASVDALEAELEKTRRDAEASAARAAATAQRAEEETRRRAFIASSSSASSSGGRASSHAQAKKRVDVLGGLGLESVSVVGAGGATRDGGAASLRSRRAPGPNPGGAKAVFGAFSIRTWLLVAYLVCLHVMAMVTPRHNVGCAIDQDKHRLPGML